MSLFEVISKEDFEASGNPPGGEGTEDAGVGDGGVLITDDLPETYPCNFCGHCETPNNCAWAHTCPVCGAPAGKIGFQTYCKTPTGGLTGLHPERWEVT